MFSSLVDYCIEDISDGTPLSHDLPSSLIKTMVPAIILTLALVDRSFFW